MLLEFVSFPCTKECPSNEQWVIRLKMIEVNTGEIIFRARISHKLDEDEQNSKLYQDLAENMISEVMAEFQAGFIVPWHRWRYEHMKKYLRSTYEVKWVFKFSNLHLNFL